MRPFRSFAVAFSLAGLLVAACGGPGGPGPAADKPTVKIGTFNFTESLVLGELYGGVLESNGYKVEYRHRLGNREIVFPALEKGEIDLVPEYLATVLAFVTKAAVKEGDAAAAHRKLADAVKDRGLVLFEFSPAVDTNAFVVTRATAQRLNLKKMSDLAPVAKDLRLGAPPECPQRPFCLQGLQQTYGITFKEFKPLDAGGPLTVTALEGNQVDVALLFSTDANITVKGFVLLEDDKKLQNADNVAPLVRKELADRGGAELRRLLDSVSAKLTTPELTELNKQAGVDKKDPRDVAREWLKKNGLIR